MGLGVFNTTPKKPKPKRTYRRNAKPKPTKVEVTEKAIKLANSLGLNWPGGEKKDELQFIQLNLNYCQSFDKRLYKLLLHQRSTTPPPSIKTANKQRLLRKIDYIQKAHLPPYEMTQWWTTEVNKVAWQWSGWAGDLLSWVFHDDHKRFNQYQARLLAQHYDSGEAWFDIHKLLKGMK